MNLNANWVNASVSLLALSSDDYPTDFLTDLEEKDYGTHLSITFLGRTGLIYLKLHAAIDPTRNRRVVDLEDLQQLNPTRTETGRVLAWLRSHELITTANEKETHQVLQTLGHEDLL